MIEEKLLKPRLHGPFLPAVWALVPLALIVAFFMHGWARGAALALAVLAAVFARGCLLINPWTVVVLQFLGRYQGTVRPLPGDEGTWYWVNPFFSRQRRGVGGLVRTPQLKVNDSEGSPVEISANLWFELVEPSKAIFEIQDYHAYIRGQAEAGLRALTMRHPFDAPAGTRSLRADPNAAALELREDIQTHLGGSGLRVNDAKIIHLAYAPEISNLMLARQQADAVVAARRQVVEAAIGTVEQALLRLQAAGGAAPGGDEVGDMLVALCSRQTPGVVLDVGLDEPETP